ncbi:MAG TPA: copper resistance CopC family protein, partial [Micromonospora sp.]
MIAMTTAKRRWIARTGVTLALLLTAFTALLGPAAPASAHAVLASSTPAADQVLSTAPAKVVLTFTESVREVPGTIRVIGPDGKRVDRGDPTFDGATVTIAVDPGGPRGTYLVSYRVISADSHPVAGGYSYSVGAPSATPSDTDAGAASTDRAVQVAVSVAKFLGYAGLLLLFGGALVGLLLWPRRLSRAGPARVVALGAGLVAVATLAGIWLQMPYTTGGGLFAISGGELTDVLSSDFGAVHLVRLAVLGAAFAILWPLLRPLPVPVTEGAAPAPTGSAAPATGEDGSADGNAGSTGAGPARSDHPLDRVGRSDKLLLALLAVGGLATWPLAGHAAATPLPPVSVLADTVHRGAMAVWVGGLVMLAVFLLRRANAR